MFLIAADVMNVIFAIVVVDIIIAICCCCYIAVVVIVPESGCVDEAVLVQDLLFVGERHLLQQQVVSLGHL